jgi:hypothetical protein
VESVPGGWIAKVSGGGTTYVTFEDVKVPVENLIGKENQGFKGKQHEFLGFNQTRLLIRQSSPHDKLQPRAYRHHYPMPSRASATKNP